ncbi:MAG: hypothetical protein Ct9H300mP15_15290 [Gemmatimonadota bacterium]|nr:MAG: hypothetical protein Ct9H300mP15_15290 [Gemmatimonadota bacterium]
MTLWGLAFSPFVTLQTFFFQFLKKPFSRLKSLEVGLLPPGPISFLRKSASEPTSSIAEHLIGPASENMGTLHLENSAGSRLLQAVPGKLLNCPSERLGLSCFQEVSLHFESEFASQAPEEHVFHSRLRSVRVPSFSKYRFQSQDLGKSPTIDKRSTHRSGYPRKRVEVFFNGASFSISDSLERASQGC